MPKFCVLILRHGLSLPIHQVLSDLGAPGVISVGPYRIQAVLTINIAAHQHRIDFFCPQLKKRVARNWQAHSAQMFKQC